MYKKCKVVMLTTENSLINLSNTKDLIITSNELVCKSDLYHTIPQHLYILSDDEIKEGDYVQTFKSIPNTEMCIHHCKDSGDVLSTKELNCKKTIATTDSSLFKIIKNVGIREKDSMEVSLPYIPQSFIDKYVSEYNKGNKIEEVMVEYIDYVQCKGEMRWHASEHDLASPDTLDFYKCDTCGDIRRSGAASILTGKRMCSKQTKINLLKLNPDNTINIKSIKDSWNRDEVIELCKKAIIAGSYSSTFAFNEWIESNL